jgi:hypothetical protein
MVPGGMTREVRLLPEAIRPLGLGGYIGTHPDPHGEIHGRQLTGILQITIHGGNNTTASAYLEQLIHGLMTQHRTDLRREGIHKLRFKSDRIDDPRSALFDLHYEYLHLPTTGGEVIDELDLNVELNNTPYRARFRWDLATSSLIDAPAPLADFFTPAVSDLDLGSPAPQWQLNHAEGCIEQTSLAQGGPLSLVDPHKAGPQLLWRPAGSGFALGRFIASLEFEASSPAGIGLVFARADADNLWYFLASEQHQYHLFGCKESGSYRFIDSPALGVGFALNNRHRLTLCVHDQTLIASLDGTQTLAIESDIPVPAGEIGFFTHGNDGARFYRARLIELI